MSTVTQSNAVQTGAIASNAGQATTTSKPMDALTAILLVIIIIVIIGMVGIAIYFLFIRKPKVTESAPQESTTSTSTSIPPIQTPPPAQTAAPTKWKIRYLKLARTDGADEFVQIEKMAIFNNGTRIKATNGVVSPPYPDPKAGTWDLAENGTGITHTDHSPNAYIEFDFGADQDVDKVQLIQRQATDAWNATRTKGVTFTASDTNKQIVFSYVIDVAYTFELNFTYPDKQPVKRVGA